MSPYRVIEMKLLPLPFLLVGCATTSIDDLYMEQSACLAEKGNCSEITESIERKEKRLAQRDYDDTNRCGPKHIEYCESRDRGCGRAHKRPDDKFYCINQDQLKDLFRWPY